MIDSRRRRPDSRRCESRFGNSPFAILAALHQGQSRMSAGGPRRSDDDSERARWRQLDRRDTPTPRAARHGFSACSRWDRAASADAQARLRRNARDVRANGRRRTVRRGHNLLAALHDYLGDLDSAWEHRLDCFRSTCRRRGRRNSSTRCCRPPCRQFARRARKRHCRCRKRRLRLRVKAAVKRRLLKPWHSARRYSRA